MPDQSSLQVHAAHNVVYKESAHYKTLHLLVRQDKESAHT